MAIRILDEPLARLRGERYDKWSRETKPSAVIRLLYWGDEVDLMLLSEATDPAVRDVRVRYHDYHSDSTKEGVIRKRKKNGVFTPLKLRANGDHLLEVLFVDVQQGDAAIIRTPDRQLLLVDGGEHAMIARALKSLFPSGGDPNTPLDIDALVITHGDADHFKGLIHLANARDITDHRELHARVRHYFHNGLVKGPDSLSEKDRFGAIVESGGQRYVTDLWSDPRDATIKNPSFQQWDTALERMIIPGNTVIDRLEYGDDAAFDFLRPGGIDVEVLGPITEPDPVGQQPSLPFLRGPRGKSASHTINGHSVVLRIGYGNVHFLLGGDLNDDAEHRLRAAVDADVAKTLRSEVLKVPHHGSHEYEQDFLNDVNPVISVVSSGDERASQDYVHPRANLLAALGRASRGPMPLLYSTEVAAFFAHRGWIDPEQHRSDAQGNLTDLPIGDQKPEFRAFERLVYGAVRVRTDGTRVVSAVESAHSNIKEAYSMEVDSGGNVTNVEDVKPL
jgi:ribonuclease BN (tRNA processing enzyme)